MNFRHLLGWGLIGGILVFSLVSFYLVRAKYVEVASDLNSVLSATPIFLKARLITESEGINVELSFRIDVPSQPRILFDALSYTLLVEDPRGSLVTEGPYAARGVYVGRYSYWGNETILQTGPEEFHSSSRMKSLYKDRLLTCLEGGKTNLLALGVATLEGMTVLGREKVSIPFMWEFCLDEHQIE